jgi:hypothetical protein
MKSEHLNVICGEQEEDLNGRDKYEVLNERWPSLDVTSVAVFPRQLTVCVYLFLFIAFFLIRIIFKRDARTD